LLLKEIPNLWVFHGKEAFILKKAYFFPSSPRVELNQLMCEWVEMGGIYSQQWQLPMQLWSILPMHKIRQSPGCYTLPHHLE
jgi:hypothetical protein